MDPSTLLLVAFVVLSILSRLLALAPPAQGRVGFWWRLLEILQRLNTRTPSLSPGTDKLPGAAPAEWDLPRLREVFGDLAERLPPSVSNQLLRDLLRTELRPELPPVPPLPEGRRPPSVLVGAQAVLLLLLGALCACAGKIGTAQQAGAAALDSQSKRIADFEAWDKTHIDAMIEGCKVRPHPRACATARLNAYAPVQAEMRKQIEGGAADLDTVTAVLGGGQ